MRSPRVFLPLLFSADQLLLELGDLRFQLGLKVIGPLVLGDLLHHHLEALQFLLQGRRPAIILLGLEILLGEIGRHGSRRRLRGFSSIRLSLAELRRFGQPLKEPESEVCPQMAISVRLQSPKLCYLSGMDWSAGKLVVARNSSGPSARSPTGRAGAALL